MSGSQITDAATTPEIVKLRESLRRSWRIYYSLKVAGVFAPAISPFPTNTLMQKESVNFSNNKVRLL
jgi:hypothetical protein